MSSNTTCEKNVVNDEIQEKIRDAIEWGIGIDEASAQSDDDYLQRKHDNCEREELARKIISSTS